MVSLLKLASSVCLLFTIVESNDTTKIKRKNVLLSRKKRYLTFPMGSNFIITLSHIKAIMQVQPRGWNFLLEIDVPFALPSDTRIFKKSKRHVTERNLMISQLEVALTEGGLNGRSCIDRLKCEIWQYRKMKEKSLVKDILYAVFTFPEHEWAEDQVDCSSGFADCSVPLLEYIIGSFH